MMRCRRQFAIVFALLVAAGCHEAAGPMGEHAAFDEAAARGRETNRPVVVLVVDPMRSEADRTSRKAFESAAEKMEGVVPVVLDLGVSRNRAAAAPLHALEGPTLLCLSPKGIILSRDEGAVTADQVRQRMKDAVRLAHGVDKELARLQTAVDAKPEDVGRRMELADFLLGHHNDREAIPHLKQVSEDESADVAVRVGAWVALGRSHLWVVEPEKARHAAQALMAILGPTSPEAMAGGNLVRGMQDTKAKRYGRAREELTAAVQAAPESEYGREAAKLLEKLPKGE